MHTIENDLLRIVIRTKGAELSSVYHKPLQLEYMWQGDPKFWSKQSPVLFPVVGALKNDTYYYQNRAYQLPRHGFAREMEFSVIDQSSTSITFSLSSTEETLLVYPFGFELRIRYALDESSVSVTYEVINLTTADMYFSIGGHPAFRVPLLENTTYADYFIEFNSNEDTGRWPISKEGLIGDEPVSILQGRNIIPLTKELFLQDAIVLKDLRSNHVTLRCNKHSRGLDFDFTGFPFLGIWAAKNADFVCIEPWCGIADSVHADQQLINKEGINKLERNGRFERGWKVTVW